MKGMFYGDIVFVMQPLSTETPVLNPRWDGTAISQPINGTFIAAGL